MNAVFEEWDAYALRKELAPRDASLDGLAGDARLKVVAVTGIRRCGKSSVLILLRQKLRREGARAAYVNLEDSRVQGLPGLLDGVLKWFGDSGYLLLDEIAGARGWEGWLARNHEMLKGRLRIIVTSSRAAVSTPAKPLRGRMLERRLHPLSFAEFIRFKGVAVEPTTAGTGRLERAVEEYLVYGGFPEVVLSSDRTDKVRLLHSYFRDIIGLDVADMASSSVAAVDLFGRYVVDAPTFSASKCLRFFQTCGHKTGKASLLTLEKCSQDGFLFFFMPIFSRTVKDREQYPRKAHLGDTGFLYAVSGRKDMGRLLENAVCLELRRRLAPPESLHYWKDREGAEADFVVREGLRVREVIQAAYSVEDEETKRRELRGLCACARAFGLRSGMIITSTAEGSETVSGIKVRYVPLWKWLLGKRLS